jgi:hypothetical protein
MPYRTNRFKICNEGLAFVSRHIGEDRTLLMSIADSIAGCLDGILMFTQSISGMPRGTQREIISQSLQDYVLGGECGTSVLDAIYQKHHDAMLDSMILSGNAAGIGLDHITLHLAWGREGDTYEVLKIAGTEHAERYWQALLIDYALTQDLRESGVEAAAAASRMRPVCFNYTVRRLFERESYGTLEEIMASSGGMWPYFEFAKWEHFDRKSAAMADSEIIGQESVFTRFHYREGLSRILRVQVALGNESGAERAARAIYSYKEDGSVATLRALFDAYICHDKNCAAMRTFERLRQEEEQLGEDDFMKEAKKSEDRGKWADDYDARRGVITFAMMMLAGNGVK